MPGESCVNAITLMLFFIALVPFLAVEATYSRAENGLAKSTDTFDHEDLSAMLRRAPFHEARVFEVARKHVQEIETSPACHQLATSTLINSCQPFSSLPGKDSARLTDSSLDEVRQEYAARLAVCELQGIKSGIPKECVPFLASHEACPRASPSGFFRKNRPVLDEPRRACYPEFTPQQLKQCVDSLFDHGQRWTSYSNAQTNAIVICQASRGAVENEQHLHKLQDALQSQASVSEALSRAVQETEERLAQHHDFAKAVQQFQHELAARNEAALTQADSMVARIVGRIDSTAEALLTALTNSFNTAADKTMNLTRNIDTVNDGVYKTRAALRELHEEAVIREAQRAASQDLALKVHQTLSSDVQATLEHLRDVTVLDLAERIIEFESTMVDFFGTQQQTFHDHFHEYTQTQNRVMQSLTSQHEIIEEHNQKIASTDFGGLSGHITTYSGLALFVIIVSWANLVLGAAAAAGIMIHGLLRPISLSTFFAVATLTPSPAIAQVIHWLAPILAITMIILLLVAALLGIATLVRNLVISRNYFGTALDLEVKREPAAYDV